MPFYNATELAAICQDVFGVEAWAALSADQRRVMLIDVEAVDAEHEEPAPWAAARELKRRIGGSAALDCYANVLLAGERRKAGGQ